MDRRRLITRHSHMYIDVLHIPSISEAVRHASVMLREGILHAMSSNVEPIQIPSSYETTTLNSNPSTAGDNPSSKLLVNPGEEHADQCANANISNPYQGPISKTNNITSNHNLNKNANLADVSAVPPASSSQTTTGRDPLSVYSAAVAKRPKTYSSAPTTQVEHPPQRDALSVYTAVTMSARRPSSSLNNSKESPANEQIQTSKLKCNDSESQSICKDDDLTSKPSDTSVAPSAFSQSQSLRAWNRDKKAGPSILSKRARPDASASVFQPVSKRERKDLSLQNASSNTANRTINPPVTADPTALDQLQQIATSKEKEKSSAEGNDVKLSSITSEEKKGKQSIQQIEIQQQTQDTGNLILDSADVVCGSKTDISKSTKKEGNEKQKQLQRHKKRQQDKLVKQKNEEKRNSDEDDAIETDEGAAAAMAVAGVSKPHSKRAMKGTTLAMTTALLGTSRQQSQALTLLRKRMSGATSTATTVRSSRDIMDSKSSTTSQITQAQKEALLRRGGLGGPLALRNGPSGNSARPLDVSTHTSPTSPSPAVSKDIKFIPGCEPVKGVEPNGYVVSERGVVKPVVTFTATPRVPHKLRQNVLEKLFGVWKDERKVGEALALQKSLKTEQETYAQSVGRVEYRAAMLSLMKDIRSGVNE